MGSNISKRKTYYAIYDNNNMIAIIKDIKKAEKIFHEANKKNMELIELVVDINTSMIVNKTYIYHTYPYM